MMGTAELLLLAQTYADAEGVSFTTISSRVFNDGKKLDAIVAGSDLYTSRLNRAVIWFSTNWPESAVWPPSIPRPAQTEGRAA
ncbi:MULTISPECIES: hypothetical protein [unclassified Bosea (in: a-proteobacteria)]|uniref:hypothetical protein n=1 Tax=unclassified Bosea (in: a-proteobacteria) TaxID=2653178 RepID=UPI000F75CCA9|nr:MULTISPECIES: hypothetical protein [unclassified Bosea (in: a-proteobacteria)]AZO77513.1 hypothetical protein BLM15_07710 [Bosea sp. Tri-49]RXT18121.1 hypothetical protein B5U98_22875 [Bosea sp. Tri-39]RXT32718.1 hypothetical protein B5U99_29220 [Bosea sp. Tri-54]